MTDRLSVELHHRDLGAGRPIMFLHGWGMSLEVWDRQVTDLGHDFRTVAVDLRGHGASPKPMSGYTYDDHAGDVLALIERLGLSDLVLVGWSMGGAIAARVAARTPAVTQLVMVGAPPRYQQSDDFPAGRPVADCAEFVEAVRLRREETMWDTAVATFKEHPGDAVAHWLYQLSVQAPTWSVLQCFEGVRAADVRQEMASLSQPLLLLHGVHDVFITIDCARWVVEHIPGVTLVEFEDSGHAPFIEERDAFNRALLDFIVP